jgi:NAD(P)-dependent dehydrogenase (short-subunit alcohol dehydrogenase family)/acyl carrier protein
LAANEPTPQNQSAGEVSASRDPFAGQGSYKPDFAVERTPAQKDAGAVFQAAEDLFAGGGHADLRLIETIIRHSSEAHQVAQKAMADSHLSYLKATELALLRLGGDNSSRAASALTSPQFGPAAFEPLQPAADILSAKADLRTARDDAADRMNNAPIHTAAPFWEQRQARQDLSPKADVPRHANSAAQGLKANDYSTLVLDVIAKKTGYPADMLKLEMELEADLGIDSIKRVEILSAFREAAPGVPAIDMSELAELRTIGSIISRLGAAPSSSVDAPPSSEPEQASNETGGDQSTLSRLILELVDASSQKTPFAPAPRTVAIVDGYSDELPGALVRALERRGVAALRISAIEEAATIQSDMVIVLTGLSASNPSDAAARSFMAAKAYASRALSEGGWFVTVQDTGGDFGFTGRIPSHAWFGGCPGLVKTAAQEWPNVRVKAIDLESGGRSSNVLADVLAAEILDGGSELEIGLDANGRRVTIREKERNVIQGALRRPSRLPDRPVFIVTGGARGVTAECMIALAKAMPCRLVLFGRTQHVTTPLHLLGLDEEALKSAVLADIRARGDDPPHLLRQVAAQSAAIQASQAIDATLQELRALGCEAVYESVDVANAAETSAAAGRVRQHWGQIDGFVHGAGQIKDKLIIHKFLDQFRSVFDTKVLGLKNLLDATQEDDLKLIVLFSSVAGRYGNSGQCDYAMANEVMNKVARAEAARRGDDCLVRSIDWGPWDGGMVTPALKRWFAERGISTIGLAQGAAAFVDELLSAGPEADQTEIILSARRREGDTPRPASAL